MKKRTLALFLAAVMLFALTCGVLTACDNSGESSQPETSESTPPELPPEVSESTPPEQVYEAKAVLADMTSQEACDYLRVFFIHCNERFTDPNTLDPGSLLMVVCEKNLSDWRTRPEYQDGGVRLTYDDVVEEIKHYFDIDPVKMNLWEKLKISYMSQHYDEETDAFVFDDTFGGSSITMNANIVPLEDRWEGDRRVITFRIDSLSQLVKPEPKYSEVFTLEQNGEYVRYVSYERIPIK